MGQVETNSHVVPLQGGATLRFVVPNSAREIEPDKLPTFEVSGLPGARVSLRSGYFDAVGTSVHLACVEAPSDRWAPGMEEIVFSMANGLGHRAMSGRMAIESWDAGSIVSKDERFDQQLSGKAKREQTTVKLLGRHVLGFEGAKKDVVLCSVICDGNEGREQDTCSTIVNGAALDGLVAAPSPSLLVQAVFFTAEKPVQAACVVGILGMLIVGLVLAKRPRPKP